MNFFKSVLQLSDSDDEKKDKEDNIKSTSPSWFQESLTQVDSLFQSIGVIVQDHFNEKPPNQQPQQQGGNNNNLANSLQENENLEEDWLMVSTNIEKEDAVKVSLKKKRKRLPLFQQIYLVDDINNGSIEEKFNLILKKPRFYTHFYNLQIFFVI